MARRSSDVAAAVLLAAVSSSAMAVAADPPAERKLTWNAHPEVEAAADSGKKGQQEADTGAGTALDDGQLMPFTMGAPVPRGVRGGEDAGGLRLD
jgi:hypothetical protein